jgi:hypothetical protein
LNAAGSEMTERPPDAQAPGPAPNSRHALPVALGVLVAGTLLAHVWSLGDGLALDDHWHFHSFQRAGWSLGDLLDATTIDTRELVSLWWQEQPVRFVYARPVAVALLKGIYQFTGGSTFVAHAVSLLLHLAAALLVFWLARALIRSTGWGLVAGLAFALYPHAVYAVSWLAAQNIILQTVLMLAALALYVRASGLVLAVSPWDGPDRLQTEQVPAMRWGLLAVVIILWVAALFSRENAIMLPGVIVAFDLAYGGWRWMWRRMPGYVIFAVVGGAFLVWRLRFYYEPMPEVYVRRAGADGHLAWCIAKLLHYVCTALIPAPMTIGPTGRFDPFTETPRDVVLMGVIVAVLGIAYGALAFRVRGWWIWPGWLLLAVLPVVPVLATPHSGYLCGVAVGLGLALALSQLAGRASRGGRVLAYALTALVLLSYAGSMKIGRLLWMGTVYAERTTVVDTAADPPPESARHVFLINWPFTSIYAQRCLAERAGPHIDGLDFHVLTFAPHLLRMDADCVLKQTGERRFTLTLRDQRYFTGLLGRFLIQGFRNPCPLQAGQRFTAEHFDVEILAADGDGVRQLAFTFRQPLSDPAYCFYLSSPNCPALRVTFGDRARPVDLGQPPTETAEVYAAADAVVAGDAQAAQPLFAALAATDPAVRNAAEHVLREQGPVIAESLAAPAGERLKGDGPLTPHAKELWQWWSHAVDDHELRAIYRDRVARARMRHQRDEIRRGRALISRYIHTDLFLTGPPYPSLRPGNCDRDPIATGTSSRPITTPHRSNNSIRTRVSPIAK